jgi:hypothetical protein
MKKQVTHFLRLAGRILEATLVISLLILLIGFVYYWDSPVNFSYAFLAAGVVLIILGIASVQGRFAQPANRGVTYAESARQADLAEHGQRAVAENTPRYGIVFFLIITGLLLIGIAVLISHSLIIG